MRIAILSLYLVQKWANLLNKTNTYGPPLLKNLIHTTYISLLKARLSSLFASEKSLVINFSRLPLDFSEIGYISYVCKWRQLSYKAPCDLSICTFPAKENVCLFCLSIQLEINIWYWSSSRNKELMKSWTLKKPRHIPYRFL